MTTPAISSPDFIDIQPAIASKLPEVDMNNIPFGRVFSDHMLIVSYTDGAWQKPEIRPYGPISFTPAMSALNYGQAIFEGMKAYRSATGDISMFRMDANLKRFNRSARRMAMPEVPEEIFVEGIKALVNLDRDWVPTRAQGALYLRPVMFATDEMLGVRASNDYLFAVVMAPVGPYYAEPVKLLTTKDYVRATVGGVGAAKTAGNYAAAMLPSEMAKDQGYHNLLWLDSKEHRFIEECGTMNLFFVVDGEVITPSLEGTILPGITRHSLIRILKDHDIPVTERRISIYEIEEAYERGSLDEAFGAGTAAGIAHVSAIKYAGRDMVMPPVSERKIGPFLLEKLTDLRHGDALDQHGWVTKL